HFLKGTQLIGGTQVKVPIGTSAFTKMVFVPQESGSHRIILAKSGGNLNINDDLDRRRIYFEKSINVERSTGSDVSAILEAADADENDVVLGNDFRIKAELIENRGTTFYDYILIRLFDKKNQIVKELQDVVSIPANGRTTSYFTFENLDPGMYRARAYSYWTSGGFRLIGASKDYLVGDIKGDVNGDGSVNVTDVTALVNMILGVIPKDIARGDIDGNGTVNVSDVTALVNIILGIN
ncbi:MAG: dockerin type I repeat-containing protein, partial [Muribaculaceae bacterium]|nr:dockerin type I repeat-containing protein [Muribaculaceae bacterium]